MNAKLTMPLVFLSALGCATPATTVSNRPAKSAPAAAEPVAVEQPPAPLGETLGEADRLYDSQLGASRAGQFEVDRQVTELRRAVLLYKQFIERAEQQPELAAAVRKSRERIDDACNTIVFLLQDDKAQPGSC
jgi:hypothetical protein